jgi:hypothetical protein
MQYEYVVRRTEAALLMLQVSLPTSAAHVRGHDAHRRAWPLASVQRKVPPWPVLTPQVGAAIRARAASPVYTWRPDPRRIAIPSVLGLNQAMVRRPARDARTVQRASERLRHRRCATAVLRGEPANLVEYLASRRHAPPIPPCGLPIARRGHRRHAIEGVCSPDGASSSRPAGAQLGQGPQSPVVRCFSHGWRPVVVQSLVGQPRRDEP